MGAGWLVRCLPLKEPSRCFCCVLGFNWPQMRTVLFLAKVFRVKRRVGREFIGAPYHYGPSNHIGVSW